MSEINFLDKTSVFSYFSNRGQEILSDLINEQGRNNPSKITSALQPELKATRDSLISTVIQKSQRENWTKDSLVNAILLLSHGANAAMLDFRNQVWPYDYMSFSRRVGELWESFCSLCFHYPLNDQLTLNVPPLFADVRNKLSDDVANYIQSLPLTHEQKLELINYYRKVWLLVDAGEIQLALDMHASIGDNHFNIDFKSGFGSNEKGNTNRLLIVASIYKHILDGPFTNLILVRSTEEEGNHYLQTLKRSGLWDVFCGAEAYDKVCELTGFNLSSWIKKNVCWKSDLSEETYVHLEQNNLLKYLTW